MVDSEEEAQDFLDRLDLEPEDFESYKTVKKAMDDLFEDVYGVPATAKQASVIFEAGDLTKVEFPQYGIQKITFISRGIEQTRYVLPFQRGLFGFDKALNLFKALK